MQKPSRRKRNLIAGIALTSAAAGVGIWLTQMIQPELSNENQVSPISTSEGALQSQIPQENSDSSKTGSATASNSNPVRVETSTDTTERIEQGEAPGSGEFTRAEFFKPLDWGNELLTLTAQEPQSLQFKPACKKHPRYVTEASPAAWAENFTMTNAAQRWPSNQTHIIDWNQFWQAKEVGYQVSIRWNFENPPRYNVVGYSFALNKPDGYGAPDFPEQNNLSWDEAKSFILNWEKKIIAAGGKPGTRTMSVAGKVFNPADVSPEDIERAEYSNSRVRSAQSGKMSCNTLSTDLSELNCSCWF